MKKLLLAFVLLAYAVMFVNPTQNTVTEVKANEITITEKITVESSAADMTGYGMEEGTNQFLAVTWEQALRIFEEDSSGILFFAKADGSESQIAAPIVNEAAKQLGIHVYYVDANQDVSQEVYNALSNEVVQTFVVDNAGNRTFYLPDVIAVKDGEITEFQVSLVSNAANPLTEEQYTELKNRYIAVMQSAAD